MNQPAHSVDFLREVETTYPVAELRAGDLALWPLLRSQYFFAYHREKVTGIGARKISPWKNLSRLANLRKGQKVWNQRHDFIHLTSSDCYKEVDGIWTDRLADSTKALLGRERFLIVELPHNGHPPNDRRLDPHWVSQDRFNAHALCPSPAFTSPIEQESVLLDIADRYGIAPDYRWAIRVFQRTQSLFAKKFQQWKPKTVFVTTYYNLVHQAAIYAARAQGIPVIEFQHSWISERHDAYNAFCELAPGVFPDHLLAFGEATREFFRQHPAVYAPEQVHPIGQGFLEGMNQRAIEPALTERLKGWSTSVLFTAQHSLEPDTIPFMCAAATLSPETLFLYLPRDAQSAIHEQATLPVNLHIVSDLNFYQIAPHVDYHATVSSTCALEAPALGTRNLLINIKGLARDYLGPLLKDEALHHYVERPEDLVAALNAGETMTRDQVKERQQNFFTQGHSAELEKVLGDLGLL